jgi:hypothetical protein
VLIVSTTRPALAFDGETWFWTTVNDANPLPYSECLRRGPAAIASQGLTANKSGDNIFYVATDSVWLSLTCVGPARGIYMILTVTTNGYARSASALGTAINNSFWNASSTGAQPNGPNTANVTGNWNWSANCNGSAYNGVFTISNQQPDGTFSGAFSDTGTIAGRVQPGRVTFGRYWGGQQPGQQWDATLDQTGRTMAGNVTGNCTGTFSASKESSAAKRLGGGSNPAPNGNWVINIFGCGYLSSQLTAALTQAPNGAISGQLFGRFDNAQKANLDPGSSSAANGAIKIVANPDGWVSNLEFTGRWDGAKFAGPLHHYGNDDCTFTMTRT